MSAPPNASTTTMVKPSPSSVLDSWSVEENVIELHPKPSHPRHHHHRARHHHSSHHPHHRHRSRSGNSERQPSSRSSLSLDDEEYDYDSSSTTSSCSTSTSTSSYYSDDDCYDGEDDDDEIRLDDFRPLPIHLNPASPLSYAASDRVCEVVRTEDIEEARLDWYRTSEELGNDEGAGGDNDSSHPRDHHNDRSPLGDPFPNHRQPSDKEVHRRHRFRKKKSKKKLKKKKRHGSVTASDAAKRRVRKSGTKVHKRHSQYALTAGMMLGLRECVGGLDGVKEELSGVLSGGEEEEGEPYGDSNHTSNHLDASSEVGSSVLNGDDRDDSGGRRRRSLRHRDAATTARRAEADASKRWRSLHAECTKTQTYEFPPGVLNRTLSSHQIIASNASSHAFQFKAYAPLVFARIRAAYGIERQPFMHSICGSSHYYEFMSNAKSGQFFFYSHDGRYMIKTQTNEECKFLRDILPRYYDYVMSNPHTFLTHFYGMYRVKMPESGKRLHFVIMKSVFDTDKEIHKVWDLKGSTKGRRAKKGDSVHKDLDMIDEGRKLNVGNDTKKAMLDQLRKDATFLARLGIMDYSLLLGVHRRPDYDENSEDENKIGPDALLAPDEALGGELGAESSIEVTPDRAAARQRSQRPVPEKMRSNTPHRRSLFASKEMTSAAAAAALADVGGDGNVDDAVSRNGDSIGEGELSPFEDEEEHGLHSWPFDEACSGLLPGPCTRNPFAAAAAAAALPRQPPSSSASSHASSALQSRTEMVYVPNPITSRSDLGIGSASLGGDGQNALAREIYYCGIIDILQHYNARKWGETVMRKAAGNTDAEISCVDPETYANRFVKFISTLLQ